MSIPNRSDRARRVSVRAGVSIALSALSLAGMCGAGGWVVGGAVSGHGPDARGIALIALTAIVALCTTLPALEALLSGDRPTYPRCQGCGHCRARKGGAW